MARPKRALAWAKRNTAQTRQIVKRFAWSQRQGYSIRRDGSIRWTPHELSMVTISSKRTRSESARTAMANGMEGIRYG